MLIEPYKEGHAIALLADGKLENLLIDPPTLEPPNLIGATFVAEIERVVKGINACFLILPNGRKGFLRETNGLVEGERVIVQASTYTSSEKAQVVSQRLVFKGRYVIITPGVLGINVSKEIQDKQRRADLVNLITRSGSDLFDEAGIIIRSACSIATDELILEDYITRFNEFSKICNFTKSRVEIIFPAPLAREIVFRDWGIQSATKIIEEKDCFDRFGIWEQISELQQPVVKLKDDAWMSIEQTQAMVVIDVNSGGNLRSTSQANANEAACEELPRQLRLRGLGGKVVIEFAPLRKSFRKKIEEKIRYEFMNDKPYIKFAGWSPLGNYELERTRDRLPIATIQL